MQGISTTIRLFDQMSVPLASINNAINNVTASFAEVENASNINNSSFEAMRHQVETVNFAAEQLEQQFKIIQDHVRQAEEGQEGFTRSIRAGGGAADGLLRKISGAVAAYASIQGITKVLGISDEMTQMTAQLDRMNDGLQTTRELQNMVFSAAQSSRGEYQAMLDSTAKLGTVAAGAFTSSSELIAFSEQLSKQFALARTDAVGAKNATLQLTQAMGSGVLRGDELNSIFEQAPTIIETIANYLEVPIGSIRELASEGQITAEIVKNALLSTAEETNAAFEKLPYTFGQIATITKNKVLMEFQPILDRLNEFANSVKFQTLVDNAVSSMTVLAGVVLGVFDAVGAVAQFANDHWSWLAPVIATTTAALILYAIAANGAKIAEIGHATWMGITTGAKIVATAITWMATGATLAQAGAQWGLNAALLACPLVWIIGIIIAIVGAIYLVVGIVNKAAGTTTSATGVIFGAFWVLDALLRNLFMGLLELVLGVINGMINPFITVANFIGNVFHSPVSSIIYLFQGMADNILGILQSIASALDLVFGSNMADAVAGWRSGLKDMADEAVAKYAPNENYQEVISTLDLSVEGFGLERRNYGDAWNTGYAAGESVDAMFANADPTSLFGAGTHSKMEYGAYDFSGIETSLNNIDGNTSRTAEFSEEDLKFMRDIAERETINRFTIAEINFEMGGVQNNVNSAMDLDGVMDYMGDGIMERLEIVAEGVHG